MACGGGASRSLPLLFNYAKGKMKMKNRFFGDRAFYRRVFAIAIPILIQNLITNFVNMLDNIMVGQVGTLPMSGVSIVNQLIFIFNLCVFGAVSGAGLFTAQYVGKGDQDGIRYTFRFKIFAVFSFSLLAIALFLFFGSPLASLYLKGEGTPEDIAATLHYALNYLHVIVIGLLPFALSQAYASTLRESGQATVPMLAGAAAMLTNLCLNYVLIFGHFGAPALGVQGAAIATVISRFVELFIDVSWLHRHTERYPYAAGLYRSFYIPGALFRKIVEKGMPLLLNEAFWAIGIALSNICFSTRGLIVVAAMNINNAIWNLFSVCFLTMGSVVGILMGQLLGRHCSKEEARDQNRKLVVFSILVSLAFGGVLAAFAGLFPKIYNTTEEIRAMATAMILINALYMPFNTYTNVAYYTLRSGGRIFITTVFDCGFVWGIYVPLAWVLTKFTALPILPLYCIIQGSDIIKTFIGAVCIRSDSWIVDMTEQIRN